MKKTASKIRKLVIVCFATTSLAIALSSCGGGNPTKSLTEICNEYSEQYQQDFFKYLSYTYHNYLDKDKCVDLHCHSEAEAVVMWAYGPGYEVWNTLLHNGNGSTQTLDDATQDVKARIGVPKPGVSMYSDDGFVELTDLDVKPQDYTYLDSALKHTKSCKKLQVYHGYEYNETELASFIKQTSGIDISSTSYEDAKKIDLSCFNGKSYTDWGYCATSFDHDMALGWACGDTTDTIVPFLDIELDDDVDCAYISYTKRAYFDNIYLGWENEHQLLINRKMPLEIKSVSLDKTQGKNILTLKLVGHKQTY